MIGLLTSRLGVAGIAALGLGLVIVLGIWQVQVANLRAAGARAISAEQQKTRDVQGQFDAYKLQVEQTIGNNARQHAAELQAALDEREAIVAETDRLRALYAREKENRTIVEAENLRILQNAPKDQDSRLDARTRAYYRELRRRQTAPTAASDQATRGNPN